MTAAAPSRIQTSADAERGAMTAERLYDPVWLRAQYGVRSANEIADALTVRAPRVIRALRRYGVPIRSEQERYALSSLTHKNKVR